MHIWKSLWTLRQAQGNLNRSIAPSLLADPLYNLTGFAVGTGGLEEASALGLPQLWLEAVEAFSQKTASRGLVLPWTSDLC